MGAAVGAAFRAAGHQVLWASQGRSRATRERAEAAGLVDAASVETLAVRCDAVVSVCPPHAAQDVADQVLGAGFRGSYLDANAIAPASARAVGDASALKVAFAAWTKASTALRAAMLAYAEAAGVREALRTQWEAYEPGFLADAEAKVQRSAPKAWRFEGEMHQIAAAFDADGVQSGFQRAAAETYRSLSPLRDADAREGPPELARVLAALRSDGEG
jgi:3-hydroxyisobutyrate dehydrogenase-like beta-hydroxyacid dehydrogenase